MIEAALPFVNAIIGAINLTALLAIAFHGGRWMGRVDQVLKDVDRRVGRIEDTIERRSVARG